MNVEATEPDVSLRHQFVSPLSGCRAVAITHDGTRLLGALGHTADEEGHKVLRSQVDESENLRDDARNLKLFEQAREWFLEDKE